MCGSGEWGEGRNREGGRKEGWRRKGGEREEGERKGEEMLVTQIGKLQNSFLRLTNMHHHLARRLRRTGSTAGVASLILA